MITLNINGRMVEAAQGETVLQTARRNDIYIPTLCADDTVAPYGACRLCLVEINHHGRKKLVASCLYPAADGLEVETDNPRIARVRRVVMELLWASAPGSPEIKDLARRLGVEKPRFKFEDNGNRCTLCALCTRVCTELVGARAISLSSRGTERRVSVPFQDDLNACVACGNCVFICPTHAIELGPCTGGKLPYRVAVPYPVEC